jgi:hypothetical protein
MIMAFLLVVVVDNAQLEGQFLFRTIDRCNFFAHMIESGAITPVDKRRVYQSQKNITAYCQPIKASPNATFYD